MGYFTLEQLQNVTSVISHGNNCPDGIASAMIVADAYRDRKSPEIRVIDHGSDEKLNLEPVPGMLFVDFSPEPKTARRFIEAGALCLDHHVKGSSVQEFVAAGQGVFADEKQEPGVCGAVLAYEHIWKPLRGVAGMLEFEPLIIQEFARLSGVRDTWQTQDPSWSTACEMAEGLRYWPLEQLLRLRPFAWRDTLDDVGKLQWARKTKTVDKIAERAFRWTSPKGTRVAAFQGVKFSSDVAEVLRSEADLIVAYDIAHEKGTLRLICSTRSRGAFDCGALAVANGGGGHTPAAGFNLPMTIESPNPYKMIQDVITTHESR